MNHSLWSLGTHMPFLAECLFVIIGAPLAPLLTHSGLEKKNAWAAATEGSTHLAHTAYLLQLEPGPLRLVSGPSPATYTESVFSSL